MNAAKFQELERFVEDRNRQEQRQGGELSWEVYKKGRYKIELLNFMPWDYPDMDEGANYFFVDMVEEVEDEFGIKCVSYDWLDNHVSQAIFKG